MDSVSLAPILTPHGRLLLAEENGAPLLDPDLARRLRDAFLRGPGHGLLATRCGRGRDRSAFRFFLLARIRGAIRYRALHAAGSGGAATGRACVAPAGPRTGVVSSGRAGHDGGGIPDGRSAPRSMARNRRGLPTGAVLVELWRSGVSQEPQPGVEPRRAGAFQPRRKS